MGRSAALLPAVPWEREEESMASEIKLPELGENVEGGEVVEVRVTQGQEVKEGQALLEVEAGKSTVEVPCPINGKVAQVLDLLALRDADLKTGQRLFLVETNGAPSEAPPAPAQPGKE